MRCSTRKKRMLRQNRLKLELCCQRKSGQPARAGAALDLAEKNVQENSGLPSRFQVRWL
jgi:hypothetical protein